MSSMQRVHYLFDRYLQRKCTSVEFEELISYLATIEKENKDKLAGPLQELWTKAKAGKLPSSADKVDWDLIYTNVLASDKRGEFISSKKPQSISINLRRFAVAAAILAAIITTGIFLFPKYTKETRDNNIAKRLPENIVPGGNKAILTLSNGSTILLDRVKNGTIAHQGTEQVIKVDSGQLAYKPGNISGSTSAEINYNTVSTPRAAQYQVILSDGTRVWLNAASSLRFPTAFNGKNRQVELTGEGYFEVAKNKEKPFHVLVGSMQVEVLGTHFNIMAYPDESNIETTLLEGSVKVSQGNKASLLVPGRQADFNKSTNSLEIVNANVNQAVAWKNGFFYFNKSDVPAIMRQVSRWYDLDIVYESVPSSDNLFSGKVERSLPLSGITHLLESGQIHFRIEGNKCIMMK